MVGAKPYISGLLYVPTRLLEGRVNVSAVKKELTAKHYDALTQETKDVPLYSTRTDGYIGLPRAWAKRHLRDIWDTADDRRVYPKRLPSLYPATVKPRDAQQADFMAKLEQLFGSDNVILHEPDLQVCAATGSGKTVSFSVGVAKSGIYPVLVVVHTNRLKEQWLGSLEQRKGLRFLFGEQWVEDNVGIIQQDVCDYEGKTIVIAMAPSLTSRRYPDAMYRYFGAVGIDEIHKMATPTFNTIMGMFPAYFHVGLTATPKDGPMGKCITAHIDEPAITSTQEVMQPKVYRVRFDPGSDTRIIKYQSGEIDDSSQSIITPLSRMAKRNRILTDLIYWRGYRRGRQCLGLSDRTDQLLEIRERLIAEGVAPSDIGMYVGAYKTGEYKLTGKLYFRVTLSKRGVLSEETVVKHLRGLPPFATRRDAMRQVEQIKREHDGTFLSQELKVEPWWHKPTTEDYEAIEKHCPIVLATYGIFDTGIDIKRLDWGIELTPRGDVAQAIGRVLRELIGKLMPEWYSMFDLLYCNISVPSMDGNKHRRYEYEAPMRLEKRRRKSYHKQNAVLIGIDNVDQAIEAAKQAARNADEAGSVRQRERQASDFVAGVSHSKEGTVKPKRKLRLVRRKA